MTGPCAKTTVRCTLITAAGERIIGENWCDNPQDLCPRNPGDDYTKCKSICQQQGHAEQVAVRLAGDRAKGARAYLEGHTYACKECQETLFAAGVSALTIGKPPEEPNMNDQLKKQDALSAEPVMTDEQILQVFADAGRNVNDEPGYVIVYKADALRIGRALLSQSASQPSAVAEAEPVEATFNEDQIFAVLSSSETINDMKQQSWSEAEAFLRGLLVKHAGTVAAPMQDSSKEDERLERVLIAAHNAIEYVGSANYAHRIKEAHEMVDSAIAAEGSVK